MGYALPAEAAELLSRSHGVTSRLLASVNGSGFVLELPLVLGSGQVQVDGKSPSRRQMQAEVYASISDPRVDPLAAEVRAEYGIVNPSTGQVYWIPVGTFVLTSVQETGEGRVAIKGADRWQRIVDARFEQPRTTSGSTTAAISALLTEADARISVVVSSALSGTHPASVWDRNRDDAIKKLAQSIGARVFFDVQGVARVLPAASTSDTVYWQVGSGRGGAKSSSRRGVSRDRTYNAVVVIGEPGGNSPPVYGSARDTATNSRTRYGGQFAKRPRFYRSSLITTTSQANTAAAALLAQVLGVARTLELNTPPNPGLDADDVLNAEVATGVWQRHITEAFTLPLGLGTTTLATRSPIGDDDGE